MKREEMVEFAVFREGAWKAKQHHRMKEGMTGDPEPQPGTRGDAVFSQEPLQPHGGLRTSVTLRNSFFLS